MKHLLLAGLALVISITAFAETEEKNNGMDVETQNLGSRYIRDYIYVPLRSGTSSSHRIVHKGLKSGVVVTLIKEDPETNYSLVRTAKGTEGWIPSQYLMAEPTAAILLAEAQETIKRLSSEAGPLSEQIVNAEKQIKSLSRKADELTTANKQLSKDLERITELAGKQIQLDETNKELLKELEFKKNQVQTLTSENERLKSEISSDQFLNGTWAVLLGIIATLVIQHFAQTRRRSDWA